jgi:hypothetical protein
MAQLNNLTLVNIYVLCWKDSNATYFPNGVQRMINCNHQNEGLYTVTTRGKVTALPNTTIVPPPRVTSPPSSPPTDWQTEQAFVAAGGVFGGPISPLTSPPTPGNTGTIQGSIPPGSDVHLCYKIKDMTTQITYYCDVNDYNIKIPGCNLVLNH